jgi:hypothetical protein
MCERRNQLRRMQTKSRIEEKVALGTRNKDLVSCVGLTATYSCHAQSRPHGVSSGVSIKLKRRHATSQGNYSEAAACLATCRAGEALTCGNGFMRGSWGMGCQPHPIGTKSVCGASSRPPGRGLWKRSKLYLVPWKLHQDSKADRTGSSVLLMWILGWALG